MHRKGLRDILIHEMCDIVASANHSISMYNRHQSMKEEMRQIYQNQCNSRWARHAPIKTMGISVHQKSEVTESSVSMPTHLNVIALFVGARRGVAPTRSTGCHGDLECCSRCDILVVSVKGEQDRVWFNYSTAFLWSL